MRTPNLLTTSI